MNHPTEETLLYYRFGTLDAETQAHVADHLRTCGDCARAYAKLGEGVERLDAYDADADEAMLAAARDAAKAAYEKRSSRTPVAPLSSAVRSAEREPSAPAWPGLLAWLGLKPGAGLRPLRFATTLLVALAGAWVGGGNAYFALHRDPLSTVVTGEESLVAGGHSLVQVSVSRAGKQLSGVPVTVALVTRTGRLALFEGKTGAGGAVDASIELPYVDDPAPSLEVVTSQGGERDVVDRVLHLERGFKVHLGTDKPLYQPGQTIHVRALAMRQPKTLPAAGKPIVIEVRDARDTRIALKELKVSDFGIASWDLELADDVALGTWRLIATVEETAAEATVDVQRYTLPKFKLSAAPSKTVFLAGERLKAQVNARYFFGQPVKGAQVRALLLAADGKVLGETKGKTDGDGTLQVAFELPASLAAPGRPESVTLSLEAKDGAGQEEQGSAAVTVSRELLSVELIPDGAALAGVDSGFFVVTTTPDGQPVACTVQVTTQDGKQVELRTAETGIGRFVISSLSDKLALEVEDAQGHSVRRDVSFRQTPTGARIVTDRAFYRPGEPVRVEVVSNHVQFSTLPIEARADGHLIGRVDVALTGGELRRGTGTLTLPAGFTGTLVLASNLPYLAPQVRQVVVAEPSSLNVKVHADKASYRPGDEAKLRFEVTDANGKPKVAALGISVVDESLFARAEAKPALVQTFFLVQKALLAPRHGVSAADLLAARTWTPEQQMAGALLLAVNADAPVASLPSYSESTLEVKEAALQRQQSLFENSMWLVLAGLIVIVFFVLLGTAAVRLPSALAGIILSVVVAGLLLAGMEPGVVAVAGGIVAALCMLLRVRARSEQGWAILLAPAVTFTVAAVTGPTSPGLTRGAPPSSMSVTASPVLEAPLFVQVKEEEQKAEPKPAEASKLAARDSGKFGDNVNTRETAPPRRDVRVRRYFPETLYVNPQLIADEKGVAELTVPLADSITAWRLSALASSADGKLGSLDAPVKVFQSFFVDLDTPVALVRGDEATVPVAIYNYLDVPQQVRLEVEPAPWFELVGPAPAAVTVGAGAVEGRALRIRVKEPGEHTLSVRADGTQESDVVARRLLVTEAGREDSTTVSGRLAAGQAQRVAVRVPEAAVGGILLTAKLYPSLGATALDGIEGTLSQPTGCFEQTSATTYPNVLVSDFLKREGRLTPKVEATAQRYLSLGYQRLVGFEVRGGGFEWFGRAPANLVLTAYGLMEFTDMARVYPVDPELIERTQRFLVSRQRPDGAWDVDASMIADGLFRSEHRGRLTVTAYVAWALAESGAGPQALARAHAYLVDNLDQAADDPYTMALITAGFAKVGHAEVGRAADALAAKARHAEGLVSWEAAGATAYYGRGEAATVETTALAAYALARAGREPQLVKGALDLLLAKRLGHGAWASTQATILALKALVTAAGPKAAPKVTVTVEGAQVGTFTLEGAHAKVLDLGDKAHRGSNVIELSSDVDAPFTVTATYTLPWRAKGDDDGKPLALEVEYGAKKLDVGEVVPVDVTLQYRGTEASGMALVELGVPAGLSPLLEDLKGKVARYQLGSGKLVLYLDKLAPKSATRLSLRFKAHTPVDTRGAGSLAYLYYDPGVRASAPAIAVAVR